MQRYKQLLFYATKLDPLPAEQHTPENKVKGCVSQVWVVPHLENDGRVYWRADSDSQLTKGLAALLVQGLSGCTPDEIVRIQPDFIAMLGLQQSLTPSRNNGFLNMFKLMQAKALELFLQQQQQSQQQQSQQQEGKSSVFAAKEESAVGANDGGSEETKNVNGAGSDSGASNSPVADRMVQKLQSELNPVSLQVVDDSYKHAGHAGFKGGAGYSGESHFTVEIVSSRFEGLTSIKRHRLVYQILEEELKASIHALSLVTKTPTEAGH